MRYHRQTLLPQIGQAGQDRLSRARVLLVGCGALGSTIADQLVRAGVGYLRLADRDVVEETNLQRQTLFDETDAREQTPKAIAAGKRLGAVNSSVKIEPRVVDVHAGNIEELAGCADGQPVQLVIDGTDNAQTRYLINDVAVKHAIPWIYGACVGVEGRVMVLRPTDGACLRCIFPQPPAPGELATCDTSGVLGPAAAVVGALQAAQAIRFITNPLDNEIEQLIWLDVWSGRFRSSSIASAKRSDCIACGRRVFEFLDAGDRGGLTSLCGRNAVQVRPQNAVRIDLKSLAAKLSSCGRTQQTPHLVRCHLPPPQDLNLTIFPDGRMIVQNTEDLDRARSVYARWVGT